MEQKNKMQKKKVSLLAYSNCGAIFPTATDYKNMTE